MANADAFGIETGAVDGPLFTVPREEIETKAEAVAREEFSPELAEKVLKAAAGSESCWFIPPLQDFLYMDKGLWLDKASDERINVPGTVTEFNWTYRLPCSLEELNANQKLLTKIKEISNRD